MSEPGRTIAAASIAAPVPHDADAVSPDRVHTAIEARVHARIASRARALRLSQRLRVTATVDDSGWLKARVELHYRRARGGTIQPVMVRIGHDAPDADVLADGGVLARCRQYNDAIDQLRQLGLQLAALVRGGHVPPTPGTPVASAQAELAELDAVIAHRQATRMGLGSVRLDVLVEETAWFRARAAALAPIVQAAERSASTAWDGDTEDIAHDRGAASDVPGRGP